MLIVTYFFGLAYLPNPENAFGIWATISYFGISFALVALVWLDNSLERAIGVHWANNWFFTILVSSTQSVLPVTGIFKINLGSNYKYELVNFLLDMGNNGNYDFIILVS